jgi:hypothetical protein
MFHENFVTREFIRRQSYKWLDTFGRRDKSTPVQQDSHVVKSHSELMPLLCLIPALSLKYVPD